MKVPRTGNLTVEELKQNLKECQEEIIRVKKQKLLEEKRELLKLKEEKSKEWSVPEWVEEDERNRKAKREKKTKKKVTKKKESQVKSKSSLDSLVLLKPEAKSPEKISPKCTFHQSSSHETKFTSVSAEKAPLKVSF